MFLQLLRPQLEELRQEMGTKVQAVSSSFSLLVLSVHVTVCECVSLFKAIILDLYSVIEVGYDDILRVVIFLGYGS